MKLFRRERTVHDVRGFGEEVEVEGSWFRKSDLPDVLARYMRELDASQRREKEQAVRREAMSAIGDPDTIEHLGVEAAKNGLLVEEINPAAAAYHRLKALDLLNASTLDLHRLLHPRHAYVAGTDPDYTIRQEIPQPRTLTWTGTETSADLIRDAIEATDGKCEIRTYRRLTDVYARELTIDTPQRIFTIKRGGTVVRAADGWVAGPDPSSGTNQQEVQQ